MSLRSFYVVLGVLLISSLHETPVKAFHPMNVRKLYDFGSEGRFKKDDINIPLPDDDVLELEKLKQKSLEGPQSPLDNEELINHEDILPTLQKQLEIATTNKSSLNEGQPEKEEQMVIQHKPPSIPSSPSLTPQHANHEHQSHQDAPSTIDKSAAPVKPFYGAARLAFGQNPEVVTTPTTTTTTTPSTISPTINSIHSVTTNSGALPSIPETEFSNGNGSKDTPAESSVSAELEATKNGERRSVDGVPPKISENLLKHKDGQYSSFDMAQYVFWTGDEAGVARAVEELIQQGLMSRESAIKFLRDIRLGIEYLQSSYTNRIFPTNIKGSGYAYTPTITTIKTPTTTLTEKQPTQNLILTENLQKTLEGIPSLLRLQEINNARKKENSIDYDEISGRMRLTDFLYAEYSLEEIIYQLAKVMFSQSFTHGSEQSQQALQRLTAFLETEGEHGRISPALQKKVLDVLLAALSDTLAENPELLSAARAGLGNSFHTLPKPSINLNP